MPNFSFHFNQTLDQGSWVPFDVSVIFGMVFLIIITICNSRGGGWRFNCGLYNVQHFQIFSRKQKTDNIQKRMNGTKNLNKKWRVKHTTSSFQTFPSIWITKNETFVATVELLPTHVNIISIHFFFLSANLKFMLHGTLALQHPQSLYECNPIQIEKYPKGFALFFSSPFFVCILLGWNIIRMGCLQSEVN